MAAAHHAYKAVDEKLLDLDLRAGLPEDAQLQVHGALAQVGHVLVALGQKAHGQTGSLGPKDLRQGLGVHPGQQVDGADVEGALHVAQLRRVVGADEPLGILHHPADLGAQFQRAWGEHQALAGTHQERVAERLAGAGEDAAGGGRAQAEAARGGRDALFTQQHVEGEEEVQVHGVRKLQ